MKFKEGDKVEVTSGCYRGSKVIVDCGDNHLTTIIFSNGYKDTIATVRLKLIRTIQGHHLTNIFK
jgi:transcription elongation factor